LAILAEKNGSRLVGSDPAQDFFSISFPHGWLTRQVNLNNLYPSSWVPNWALRPILFNELLGPLSCQAICYAYIAWPCMSHTDAYDSGGLISLKQSAARIEFYKIKLNNEYIAHRRFLSDIQNIQLTAFTVNIFTLLQCRQGKQDQKQWEVGKHD
jgi:hypothetical protein